MPPELPLTGFELLQAQIYAAELYATCGGKKLKTPAAKMLLGLVIFGGYVLFPSKTERDGRP